MNKDLLQIIREEVMQEFIHKGNGLAGSDLRNLKFDFLQIKDILYNKLMEIEIRQVKEKWNRE